MMIVNRIDKATKIYSEFVYDVGYRRFINRDVRFIQKPIKQLIVKIIKMPYPEALVSTINYIDVFAGYDPVFMINGKKFLPNKDGSVNLKIYDEYFKMSADGNMAP